MQDLIFFCCFHPAMVDEARCRTRSAARRFAVNKYVEEERKAKAGPVAKYAFNSSLNKKASITWQFSKKVAFGFLEGAFFVQYFMDKLFCNRPCLFGFWLGAYLKNPRRCSILLKAAPVVQRVEKLTTLHRQQPRTAIA